ncbi:MAG: OsmC family protein [Dongiaceae bacterium]
MSANAMKKPVADFVNGIDVDTLAERVGEITADPQKGMVEFRVKSEWKGQTRSEATVESYKFGGEKIDRRFTFGIDEPFELLGENTAPNPQEYLMAALNACVMVGYVAGAAIRGIRLDSVEIETQGELDLRGFLGIDPDVKPGYDRLRYTVRIKGDGTAEQFREIHETVIKTSPNYFNIAKPVAIDADLVVVK